MQALLGFPDLRAAVVAGWHRGGPVSELVIVSEVAALRGAIIEVLPAGWVLTDDAICAPAGDRHLGRVTAADLGVRLGHLGTVLGRAGAATARAQHWQPWQAR